MKLSRPDISLMRGSILALCASAILVATALYHAARYVEEVRKNRHEAQLRLNDARSRLAAAREAQHDLTTYSGEYRALERRNIIGDEPRLDWMEGLEKIRQQRLVAVFHYNIAPRQLYAPNPPLEQGSFDIRSSEMKLQFGLLHEVQLLNFFAAVRGQINGWFQLDGCSLQRGSADEIAKTNHLTAECSGRWITLKNRNTPQ